MKKVFLGVGHGGSDPGAVANGHEEADINLSIALACRDELERHGVEVRLSRTVDEDDPLTDEIAECNAYSPDLAVDCHTNAGGGDGFEAFYTYQGGVGKVLAENIEAEILALGQNSRGCKIKLNNFGKDYFGFIRQINCPAVICEIGFIDNQADLAAFDEKSEQQAFGRAYAHGILKTLGIDVDAQEGELEMKRYQYVKDMPAWAQDSVTKAIQKGIVAMNEQGAVDIYEPNLQTLVWMDRAGMLELPELLEAMQK